MKNTVIILLAISTFALCGVLLVKGRKPAAVAPDPQAEKLRQELDAKEQRIAELESSQRRAEEQSREIAGFSDQLAAEAQARELALSNALATAKVPEGTNGGAGSQKGGLGKLISGMMQDPEMKQFIREQQRTVMTELYRPLLTRFKLTAEESERFSDILSSSMDKGMEMAASMFGGSEGGDPKELAAAARESHQKMEEEMKALLGEERYAEYQNYQQTVGERAQLNQFRQMNTGGEPITDAQSERLLTLMQEEKRNVSTSSGLDFPGQDPGSLQDMLGEGKMEKLIEAQQTVNQNVYNRAGEVLSPTQLESFARFQSSQLQNLRMGLTMARKFMTPEGGK